MLTALVVFVWFVNNKPDLRVWHTADLDAEYVAGAPVEGFDDYLALEDRLFAQLEVRVLDEVRPSRSRVNRFQRGSLSDPERWPRNWNRSFELEASGPSPGVLLLHGMSDSPYSLRTEAQALHRAGAHVLGLRIPGHGTAPVGLTTVRWQDMAGAVRLAMRHLAAVLPDQPLFVVGYSNGAALAVHYALETLEDPTLPRASGLVLLSPQIGITRAAAFAIWQERIGALLRLEKLQWNTVLPEYDPFKYQSFAMNAGDQSYRITQEIGSKLAARAEADELHAFPRVLAFQSAVDATVSARAVVTGLLGKLPENGHELVLFDLNRMTDIEPLLTRDPGPELEALLASEHPFLLRVIANENDETVQVVARSKRPGAASVTTRALGLAWPRTLFSLSHVALPFPASDPLYGDGSGPPSPGIHLGDLAYRGERGVLRVSAGDMLRLRWNPFEPYVRERLLEFTGLVLPRAHASSESGLVPEVGFEPTRAVKPGGF